MTLAERIAATPFSVYGIVDHPLGLTSYGVLTTTGDDPSITLIYESPRYSSYTSEAFSFRNLRVLSAPSRTAWMHGGGAILDVIIQEQAQPVRNSFRWEGTIMLEGRPFCGTIQYYASPVKLSGFYLKSEETVLSGHSYGPSCDEVIELLEGLQVLNGRNDVLRQYDNS